VRILITGGAGFIGSNLVRYLNARQPGWHVRVLDDFSAGSEKALRGLEVEVVAGSVLDSPLLDETMRSVDAIVHLAEVSGVPRSIDDPGRGCAVNVTGTLNVLEAARRSDVGHFIYASSDAVYGGNPELPRSETHGTRPMSPYGASKLAAESYVLAYGSSYGLGALAFRLFSVYGPGQSAAGGKAPVVATFLYNALRGVPLTVTGDGEQTRDFTYVDSVCAAIEVALTEKITSGDPVNLAFGTRRTLIELAAEIELIVDFPLAVNRSAARIGDVQDSQADDSRLRELFPSVAPVELSEGLLTTIKWLGHEAGFLPLSEASRD
jgi:UDP-glucose 4-epimerase